MIAFGLNVEVCTPSSKRWDRSDKRRTDSAKFSFRAVRAATRILRNTCGLLRLVRSGSRAVGLHCSNDADDGAHHSCRLARWVACGGLGVGPVHQALIKQPIAHKRAEADTLALILSNRVNFAQKLKTARGRSQ
jgi:hypothetical protein